MRVAATLLLLSASACGGSSEPTDPADADVIRIDAGARDAGHDAGPPPDAATDDDAGPSDAGPPDASDDAGPPCAPPFFITPPASVTLISTDDDDPSTDLCVVELIAICSCEGEPVTFESAGATIPSSVCTSGAAGGRRLLPEGRLTIQAVQRVDGWVLSSRPIKIDLDCRTPHCTMDDCGGVVVGATPPAPHVLGVTCDAPPSHVTVTRRDPTTGAALSTITSTRPGPLRFDVVDSVAPGTYDYEVCSGTLGGLGMCSTCSIQFVP